ncbi:MAG: STAS domain-containing protein [Actinomycetota bacterium]|nr:STAS domain-containing protein [Actinomycetota bacterium]
MPTAARGATPKGGGLVRNFSLDTALHGDRCELVVTGEIDIYTADDFAALGMGNLTEDTVGRLVVDLAGVTFIDSTGLGALVRIRNIALEVDKDVTFRDPSPRVQKLFKLTGLDGVFATTTAIDAVKSPASPAPG